MHLPALCSSFSWHADRQTSRIPERRKRTADVVERPDESADKSWAGAGAFEFVFSEYREEQGFTDCDVHCTLRWIEDDGVPCDGCAAAGVVAVNVVMVVRGRTGRTRWSRSTIAAVYPDSEEVLFYNGETLTDMRDIGWEVQWAADSVHLVGTSTDHTYYAMESRTLDLATVAVLGTRASPLVAPNQ